MAYDSAINPHELDHLSHLWRYFRSTKRRSDEARGVTDSIRTVTGTRAQTLEDFFRADAAEFGGVPAAS
jgi:hypothetical protein